MGVDIERHRRGRPGGSGVRGDRLADDRAETGERCRFIGDEAALDRTIGEDDRVVEAIEPLAGGRRRREVVADVGGEAPVASEVGEVIEAVTAECGEEDTALDDLTLAQPLRRALRRQVALGGVEHAAPSDEVDEQCSPRMRGHRVGQPTAPVDVQSVRQRLARPHLPS